MGNATKSVGSATAANRRQGTRASSMTTCARAAEAEILMAVKYPPANKQAPTTNQGDDTRRRYRDPSANRKNSATVKITTGKKKQSPKSESLPESNPGCERLSQKSLMTTIAAEARVGAATSAPPGMASGRSVAFVFRGVTESPGDAA